MFRSGTTLVFSNEEIDDIIKIVKSIEYADLLIKGICETVENESKEEKKITFRYVGCHLIS